MLFHKLYHDRWFVWTLVFLFVAGSALVGYIQWSTIELDTTSTLLLAAGLGGGSGKPASKGMGRIMNVFLAISNVAY